MKFMYVLWLVGTYKLKEFCHKIQNVDTYWHSFPGTWDWGTRHKKKVWWDFPAKHMTSDPEAHKEDKVGFFYISCLPSTAVPGACLLVAQLEKGLSQYGSRCQQYGTDVKATHLLTDFGSRKGPHWLLGHRKHAVYTGILYSLEKMECTLGNPNNQ